LTKYVVSLANKVVAGPFPTAAAAVKAKENVVKPGPLKSGKGL
jgi:hypothetical protein